MGRHNRKNIRFYGSLSASVSKGIIDVLAEHGTTIQQLNCTFPLQSVINTSTRNFTTSNSLHRIPDLIPSTRLVQNLKSPLLPTGQLHRIGVLQSSYVGRHLSDCLRHGGQQQKWQGRA